MPGGGVDEHGFGVQVVPEPRHVLGDKQAACVATVQVPTVAQQAPVVGGCGHRFGVQDVPAPRQSLGNTHATAVVTVQLPVGAQQAPVTGGARQLFGWQLVHSACQTLGAWQFASVATEHTPAAVQHAPVAVTGGVGSSFPQPTETIANIAARITSLRIVRPPSSLVARLPGQPHRRHTQLHLKPLTRTLQHLAILCACPTPVARRAGLDRGRFPLGEQVSLGIVEDEIKSERELRLDA